jgi:hypothetical protein
MLPNTARLPNTMSMPNNRPSTVSGRDRPSIPSSAATPPGPSRPMPSSMASASPVASTTRSNGPSAVEARDASDTETYRAPHAWTSAAASPPDS